LSNEVLTSSDEDPDHNKVGVFKHSFEDVDLIIDLSGGKHVEDLEDNKNIENDSEMSRWSAVFERSVNVLSLESLHHTVHHIVRLRRRL
jgi:hypothetical protein